MLGSMLSNRHSTPPIARPNPLLRCLRPRFPDPQHWPFPSKHVMLGYAYILTHPGIPCLFWEHHFGGLGR